MNVLEMSEVIGKLKAKGIPVLLTQEGAKHLGINYIKLQK